MAEGKRPDGPAGDFDTVVFDLGGVLIDWNPRHLYRKLFSEVAAMEHFLATVCTQAWHEQTDEGRPTAEITTELTLRHFDGLVISGEVGMNKPDPGIFQLLIERFGTAAGRSVFIDDMPYNVAAADAAGLKGLHFTSPANLRDDLIRLGIL